MSINKRLDALFEEIEHDIEAAKDETELIEVINKISNFGQPLKYDNTWPAIIATMATITAVVMIYLPFHSYSNNPVFFMPASLIAAVVAGMAFFIWGSRASKADTYADKLFAKDVLFDNDLTPVECNPERQHKAWASSFLEFNRGNRLLKNRRSNLIMVVFGRDLCGAIMVWLELVMQQRITA